MIYNLVIIAVSSIRLLFDLNLHDFVNSFIACLICICAFMIYCYLYLRSAIKYILLLIMS